MIDIKNPNIPIMSDEGLEKIMLLYNYLYNNGIYKPKEYIVNLIKLSTDYNSTEYNKNEYDAHTTEYSIEVLFSLLQAMKEDIENYGLNEYINRIKKQCVGNLNKYMTYAYIYKAINCPKEIIKEYILTGKINELPEFIQYLYNQNKITEEHNGNINTIPYVTDKYTNDPEQYGQGRKVFRVYLNNPIGKSGLDFYLLFVNKLIEKRIPFENKFCYNENPERKDKSIFYFATDYLNDVMKILDDIDNERPDLTSKFGTPPTVCAQSTYYAISHVGTKPARTYNMFFNDVIYYAYLIYFCKKLLLFGSISADMTEEERIIVKKYYQGVLNYEVFNEIKNHTIPSSSMDMIENIIKKYSNQFKIPIVPNDFRPIIQQVASVILYGDLDHKEYPICFNENFYDDDPFVKSKKHNS